MVQAAAQGLIDFSQIDPRSTRDDFKVRVLLTEMQKQNEIRLYDMLHRQIVSQLGNSSFNGDSLKNVWGSANTIYDKSKDLELSWLKKTEKEKTKAEEAKKSGKYVGLQESWSQAFGDLDDPLIKAQIEATSRWLLDEDESNN